KEALQHIRYMTKHRMVINFSKLYAMKTSSGKREEEVRDRLEGDRYRVLEQYRPEVRPMYRFIRRRLIQYMIKTI
ncbi:MAG: hypothetical protein ACKPKO_31495, partial [Candidatus Fonsibacter sp.]